MSLTLVRGVSLAIVILGIVAILTSVIGISLPYWLVQFDVGSDEKFEIGLWQSCYTSNREEKESECTSLTVLKPYDVFHSAQALAIIGLLFTVVPSLFKIVSYFRPSIIMRSISSKWLSVGIVVLYLLGFLFITAGFLNYLDKFIRINQWVDGGIGYSFILMVCATLLTELTVLCYAVTYAFHLKQKPVHRMLNFLPIVLGILACLLAVVAIATPSWYRVPKFNQIFGLWVTCAPSSQDPDKIICVNIINDFLQLFPDARKFYGPQVLSIVSLLFLVAAVVLSGLTNFQFNNQQQNSKVKIGAVVLILYTISGLFLYTTFVHYLVTFNYFTRGFSIGFALVFVLCSAASVIVSAVLEAVLLGLTIVAA